MHVLGIENNLAMEQIQWIQNFDIMRKLSSEVLSKFVALVLSFKLAVVGFVRIVPGNN